MYYVNDVYGVYANTDNVSGGTCGEPNSQYADGCKTCVEKFWIPLTRTNIHITIVTTVEYLNMYAHLSYKYTDILTTCSAVRYRHLQGWWRAFYRYLNGICLLIVHRHHEPSAVTVIFYLLPRMKSVLSRKFLPQANSCRKSEFNTHNKDRSYILHGESTL
jgi:hypothetical protein